MKLQNLSIKEVLEKIGHIIPEGMTADEFQLQFRMHAHKPARIIDLTDADFIAKKLDVNLADLVVAILKIIRL
ncbi:MAG: hypothetical protein CMM93_08585 [Rickettsiales bacterium]|nr:hypothetical protein [Rickettsiales bacterium]